MINTKEMDKLSKYQVLQILGHYNIASGVHMSIASDKPAINERNTIFQYYVKRFGTNPYDDDETMAWGQGAMAACGIDLDMLYKVTH